MNAALQTDLEHGLRHARRDLILRGVLAVGFGIFALARPVETVAIFALAVAIWALATGFVAIVDALELRRVVRHWWLILLTGIVSALFGVFAMRLYPALPIAFIVVWVAWWLFALGVLEIATAMQNRRLNWSWGWNMVLGIVSIIAAIFALLSPPTTLRVLTLWVGISALLIGLALLLAAAYTGKLKRRTEAARDELRTRRAA